LICFVDTSALLAVLDADDQNHPKAKKHWETLIYGDDSLVSTNYVLVETFALVQHRLGIKAVSTLQEDVVPLLTIEWVNQSIHQEGLMAAITTGRRKLSLVDCVSFAVMRRMGIKTVFAFDKHFNQQGFRLLPS